MTTRRRRKCRHCGQLFRPDPRNLRHQRYCSARRCQCASETASQRRWLAKAANRDYFRGPEQMARVRTWRAAHPGYGRKKPPRRPALQEHSSAQPVDIREQSGALSAPALQDLSRAQSLVLTVYMTNRFNSRPGNSSRVPSARRVARYSSSRRASSFMTYLRATTVRARVAPRGRSSRRSGWSRA